MGRWGDGIYESDQSLDFLHSTVTQKLTRELVYLSSPEQVKPSGNWLYEVLSIVEIMLLFDVRQFDYTLLVHLTVMTEIINRIQTTTLEIWDAAWTTDEKFLFSDASYRKQNRQILLTWFERLSVICDYYYGDDVVD